MRRISDAGNAISAQDRDGDGTTDAEAAARRQCILLFDYARAHGFHSDLGEFLKEVV